MWYASFKLSRHYLNEEEFYLLSVHFKQKFIKCVFMCRNFKMPSIQTIAFASVLNNKQRSPEHLLHRFCSCNADVGYFLQLRHLSNKIKADP